MGPDTIRILITTDNHVGYAERDPIRKDDSWKSFDEAMRLARKEDVDMILLAGDLFHDNKPSRQAMYQVMRSLRLNCLGEKPCELEMLSDKAEVFEGTFNHVNYEDPDINVAIPVFSIHGNHDDPTGDGHLAALDLLQMSGLVNYYGRTHESDKIDIKPVLLQKGRTKLALYGMSNVRDERLFRTFRDGNVKFFRPGTQRDEWFNLLSVHQNHNAHTETSYLPEHFLPNFMDFVVWGHEHECLIQPRLNPEMNFSVSQPGSTVATSLIKAESVAKHVAIMEVTGREYHLKPIRLKSVRPFVYRDLVLAEDPVGRKVMRKKNNRTDVTRRMTEIVEEMIVQAKEEWLDCMDEDREDVAIPLPLIRLRVDYTAPEGCEFDCENPQRFSNRFMNKVANVNDVVQFNRKTTMAIKRGQNSADDPEATILEQLAMDSLKVEKLVKEFLAAQSLTILPQNSFGDAVTQFVDKDDKHAMELFVNDSLKNQVENLLKADNDNKDLAGVVEAHKSKMESLFDPGHLKQNRRRKLKPKPDRWDSDLDGEWADQPGAVIMSDTELPEDEEEQQAQTGTTKGRAKSAKTTATQPKKSTAKNTSKAAPARSRKKAIVVETDEDENDSALDFQGNDDSDDDDDNDANEDNASAMQIDDEHETQDSGGIFLSQREATTTRNRRQPQSRSKAPAASTANAKAAKTTAATSSRSTAKKTTTSGAGPSKPGRQADLRGWASQQANPAPASATTSRPIVVDDIDDDDDDEDAFESAPIRPQARARGRR